ncbi:potassium transporter TrkA, partial [Streptomyces sp. NPDC059122]
MVVCGDDALAHRLAAELRDVYGERVTLIVPSAREPQRPRVPSPSRGLGRATALLGRVSAAVARGGPGAPPPARKHKTHPPTHTPNAGGGGGGGER